MEVIAKIPDQRIVCHKAEVVEIEGDIQNPGVGAQTECDENQNVMLAAYHLLPNFFRKVTPRAIHPVRTRGNQ